MPLAQQVAPQRGEVFAQSVIKHHFMCQIPLRTLALNSTFFGFQKCLNVQQLMSQSLDRRLETFQAKLQQHIDIHDDEIARMTDYLAEIQAETAEVKDALTRLTIQAEQAKQDRIGKKQYQRSQNRAKASRMKRDLDSIMQDLEETHRDKVQAITDDFEKMLGQVEEWAENLGKEKIKPLNAEIAKLERQIENARAEHEKLTKSAGKATTELDFLVGAHELDAERIATLQAALREKNQDRLQSLLNMKQQLTECVSTLEELEHAHAVKMDKLKSKLELMDNDYERKVKDTTESHEREMGVERRRIQEAVERAKEIEKQIEKTERQHAAQMQEATQSGARMRMDIKALGKKPAASRKEISDSLKKDAELYQLKLELERREAVLAQERENNDRLKREVSRVRDELRLAERRAALNLQ